MKNKPLYSESQWKWIAKRYIEGYRISEISEFLGVHPNTVSRHLDLLGVDRMLVPLSERKNEFFKLALEDKDENE